MSIASELNRLLQAKSDLATSITNKGVTVPSATTLDGYAALVDQIQQGGGSLPYDAEIDYLQSDGSAYINTGLKSSNDEWEFEAEVAITNSGNVILFGSINGFNVTVNNNKYRATGQVITNVTSNINRFDLIKLVINPPQNSIKLTINGTNYTGTYSSWVYDYYLGVFGRGDGLNVSDAKMRYLRIKKNNILVKYYIPVRSEQVGYMYERVGKVLCGNDGSGSFTLGPDVI